MSRAEGAGGQTAHAGEARGCPENPESGAESLLGAWGRRRPSSVTCLISEREELRDWSRRKSMGSGIRQAGFQSQLASP